MNTHEALRVYLRERPLAFALWRYSELQALTKLDWPEPILDAGCGDGLFGSFLFSQRDVVGVDQDEASLELARKRNLYSTVVRAPLEELPFDDEHFGSAHANCVMEHVSDPLTALREVRRVLRPGAPFVFTVPSEYFGRLLFWSRILGLTGVSRLRRRYEDLANRILDHRHVVDAPQWGNWLKQAGFCTWSSHYYAPPKVAAAFDLAGTAALPTLLMRRLTGAWVFPPKPHRAASWIEQWVGEPHPPLGAGLVICAVA